MEFHQVRYFMALSTTLNFTRAAEICNVSQPALTRAIQNLEHELGGALVIREGRLTHLTELGQRVLPSLRECYRQALSAQSLARECHQGERASLRLATVPTVGLDCIAHPLAATIDDYPAVDITVLRGSNEELLEHLKFGRVDLLLTDADLTGWGRLDAWTVGREAYTVVVNEAHALAKRTGAVAITELIGERVVCLPDCALARELVGRLVGAEGVDRQVGEVPTVSDIFALLAINAGLALLPVTLQLPPGLVRVDTWGMRLEHLVRLYAVAGRRRLKAVAALVDTIAGTSRNASDYLLTAAAA